MHNKTFEFNGIKYKYFEHDYNKTYSNERAVEIPIIWKIVQENKNKKILEVGNVLSHYFDVSHDIVDVGEKAENVINEDIRKYKIDKLYDLIVSISTLEHIKGSEKETKALFDILSKLLASKGKLVVTIPLGTNSILDRLLKKEDISFQKIYCLKRISVENDWKEQNWKKVKKEDFSHYAYFDGYVSIPFIIGAKSVGKTKFVFIGIKENK